MGGSSVSSLHTNANGSMEDGPVAALCHALEELGMTGGIRVEPVGPGSAMDSLVIIPDVKAPRIIVPAGQRSAASSSLQRYSADLGLRQRVQRLVASTTIRLWGPRAPIARYQLVLNSGINQGLIAHLSQILGQPVTFSMTIGNARANQKPILQLFSVRGKSLGFAKVGTNEFTAELVRKEAENLRSLNTMRLKHLSTPSVLRSGRWHELELLVMTTLPSTALSPANRLNRLRLQAEEELAAVFAQGTKTLRESAWFRRLLASTQEYQSASPLWVRWQQAMELLARNHGLESLEFTASHGDWTAWNMADYHGRLQVWDWERFIHDVPAGFDQLHFAIHRGFGRTGVNTETLRAVLGEQRDLSRTVLSCYLSDLSGRYLLGEREQQVSRVQQKTAVLVTVLEEILGE